MYLEKLCKCRWGCLQAGAPRAATGNCAVVGGGGELFLALGKRIEIHGRGWGCLVPSPFQDPTGLCFA